MNAFDKIRGSGAFADLLALSERLGRNPLQVQAAGGNTSLKSGDAMMVKASGLWLADARNREIMVPVDTAGLRQALKTEQPFDAMTFVPDTANPEGLRPSIETAMHAVFPWPVVLHTHCVATIALSLRQDADALVRDRLDDLGAVFIPYVKPGLNLARAIAGRMQPDTTVLILGNHGLVVGADAPNEAELLLQEISSRLDAAPSTPFTSINTGVAPEGWKPVAHAPTQAIAYDPALLTLAKGNTLYPDHLIFLGRGVVIAEEDESVEAAVQRASQGTASRKLVISPSHGAFVPADASPSVEALAHAFGDVLLRIDQTAPINRLSDDQEAELLGWDAEKYRQALEKKRETQ